MKALVQEGISKLLECEMSSTGPRAYFTKKYIYVMNRGGQEIVFLSCEKILKL